MNGRKMFTLARGDGGTQGRYLPWRGVMGNARKIFTLARGDGGTQGRYLPWRGVMGERKEDIYPGEG